jgi:hypothetical protein
MNDPSGSTSGRRMTVALPFGMGNTTLTLGRVDGPRKSQPRGRRRWIPPDVRAKD